jgi:uncharacterized protein YpuA (DUF1002 family)
MEIKLTDAEVNIILNALKALSNEQKWFAQAVGAINQQQVKLGIQMVEDLRKKFLKQ